MDDDLFNETWAYIVGVALGDGNLSNPNGRAIRLRITCDSKYPEIGSEIRNALRFLLPENEVSVVLRKPPTCFDISVYSNKLNELLPWKVGNGTKLQQNVHVPNWILNNENYSKHCLRELIQTDGCIYIDRGYKMINFVNYSEQLAKDVQYMLNKLEFRSTYSAIRLEENKYRYLVRITRDVENFIQTTSLYKA